MDQAFRINGSESVDYYLWGDGCRIAFITAEGDHIIVTLNHEALTTLERAIR